MRGGGIVEKEAEEAKASKEKAKPPRQSPEPEEAMQRSSRWDRG